VSLREFTSTAGVVWQVWDTVPGTPHEAELFAQNAQLLLAAEQRAGTSDGGPASAGAPRFTPGREGGWLTFLSETEKRRLSPIPDGWATATERELTDWLQRADPVHLSAAAARLLRQLPLRDA
jgi:hypothetical protein